MQRDEFGGIVLDAPANDSQQPAPQAGQQRDEFGGIIQGASTPAPSQQNPTDYLKAHGITDPQEAQAYYDAFNKLQSGQTGPVHAPTATEVAQGWNKDQGQLASFGNALGQTLAHPIEGAVGLVAPQAANDLRQFNEQTYAHPNNAGAFVGNQAGNLINSVPAMMAPGIGIPLSAAEAMGNKRIDIAQQRAAGQKVSGGAEAANVLGTGAIDAAANYGGAKLLGATGGAIAKQYGGQLAKAIVSGDLSGITSTLVKSVMANVGKEVAGNQVLAQAQNFAQNLVNHYTANPAQKLTEGAGEAALGAFIQSLVLTPITAAHQYHSTLAEGSKPPAPVPVPDAETMKTLTEQPAAGEKSYPKLDAAVPKYRNHDKGSGESYAGPVEFEHPDDKALYVATQPRPGKATEDATSYLKDKGYTDDQIQQQGQELRQRVTEQVNPLRGEPARIARPQAVVPGSSGEGVTATPQSVQETRRPVDEDAVNRAIQSLPDIRPQAKVVTPGKLVRAAASVAEKTLGVKVVHINDEGGAAGFTSPAHPGVVFIDARRPVEGWASNLAHEWMHNVQDTDPHAAGKFYDAIPDQLKQKYLDEYKGRLQGLKGVDTSKYLNPENVRREVGAMALGDAASRVRVRNAILQKSPGIFEKITDIGQRLFDKLSGKSDIIDKAINLIQEKGNAGPTETKARAENAANADAPSVSASAVGNPAEKPTRPVRPQEADVSYLPEHHDRIRDEAREYAQGHGLPYNPDHTYAEVNVDRAKQIAQAYDAAQHEPNNPAVKRSYDAFKRETLDQFNFLQKKGIKFEEWKGEGQPYQNSAEMMKDARENKHLWFFSGGSMAGDHPLAERAPGTPYTYNDVFRAVHDYFGHAKEGLGFGPRGEENAWRSHSQMYSDVARPAMTAETRGQNSWVNFGPHGEANQANPAETHYAEQKATTLPHEYSRLDEEPSFLPKSDKEKKKALENLHTAGLREEPANAEDTMFGKQAPRPGSHSIEDVAAILNKRAREIAGTDRAGEAPKLERAIAAGVPELEYQLQQPDSGKDWYKGDIAKMEKTVQQLQPQTKDPAYMSLFKTVLGITSQGNNPLVNFKHADPIFGQYVESGKLPLLQPNGKNWPGTLGENFKLPLGRLQGMLDDMGVKGAMNWLLSKHTVGEVNQWSQDHGFNANVHGPKDASVYGMEIFGPKIGTFILNQHGIQEKITKDMWFSRTWNRWMGTMLDENGEIQDSPRNDAEREVMDKAVGILASKLKMDPMDVQATLWYYEQQLWKAHGAKVESGSYSKAAERVLGGDRYDYGSVAAGGKGEASEGQGQDAVAPGLYSEHGTGGSPGGGPPPSFLPGQATGRKFIDEDVKPALSEAADRIGSAWDGVKSLVAPQARTEQAGKASRVIREMGADLAQRYDRLGAAFEDTKKYFDKVPVAQTRGFIDQMEHGPQVNDPALQPVADALRGILDDRLKQVQALGTGKLQQFVMDYFPHLWADPKKAGDVYRELIGKTPMQGAKNFLKQRTLQTFSDGISRGLTPVTENPVEAVMMRVREMDKYITAQRAFAEMQGMGLMKKVQARKTNEAQQQGFEKINDNIATIFAPPNRRGGISTAGYWMAPEAVANVINNHLSPGLRNSEHFGGAFRAYLGAGNAMNQVQLGLSGFHLLMTTLDSATSKLGLSFKQAGSGQFGEAAKSLGTAATVFGPAIQNVRNGGLVMKEWLKPGSTTPEIAQVVDAMKAAGGRIKMDDFYHTGMTDKMMTAFRKGNVLGGLLRAPLGAIEAAAKPLMEHVVPRMKMGVFMDMAKYELSKLGPQAGRDEVREAMSRSWDSVDNRMGEMVYDNLFWNKAIKDLSMASVRSVGWNLGTLRELGGGVYDLAKNAAIAGKDRSFKNTEFTHRMAYTAAMPIMAGMVGGMLHYALNGSAPQTLKDWFFPQTGEKDKEGHAIRLALPSYIKDVLEYGKDVRDAYTTGDATKLGRTLANKTHPLLNTLWEMLRNEDYYGNKIRNEDDPFVKKLADEAAFAGKQFVPFGTREVAKLADQGQGARSLLPLVGITRARHDIINTPAENTAQELMKDHSPPGHRTQEQVEKSKLVRQLGDALHNDEPDARDRIREAFGSGQITQEDIDHIRAAQKSPGLLERTVRHLGVQDAFKVWEEADAGERKRLGPVILSKLRSSKSLTPTERAAFVKKFQDDWKQLQVGQVAAEE